MQDGQNSSRLFEIQTLLNLERYSKESELRLLQKYQDDINAHFDSMWTGLELMRGPRLEEFKNCHDFQTWQGSPKSCMLVIAGYNNESVYYLGECWMSTIALDVIQSIRDSERGDPYAFDILGLRKQEDDTFPQVLSRLILQLLMSDRLALQNDEEFAELCAITKEYTTWTKQENTNKKEYGDTSYTFLREVALKVLKLLDQTKTVWIILDGVNRCGGVHKSNHRKSLMKTLAYLVEKAPATVRVLAVVNGYDWKVDEEVEEIGQPQGGVIIHTARQGTIVY